MASLRWLEKFELRTVEVRAYTTVKDVFEYGLVHRKGPTTFSDLTAEKPIRVYIAVDLGVADGGTLSVFRGVSVSSTRSFSFGNEGDSKPVGVYDSLRVRVDKNWAGVSTP